MNGSYVGIKNNSDGFIEICICFYFLFHYSYWVFKGSIDDILLPYRFMLEYNPRVSCDSSVFQLRNIVGQEKYLIKADTGHCRLV